jgi:signal transduction histidine kinase
MGEKLYDPFYSTKKGDQGTGLGLAIVKTFVDKLHGKIDYRNNEDGGVTFTISICKTDKKKQQ